MPYFPPPFLNPSQALAGTPVDDASPGGSQIAPSEMTTKPDDTIKVPFTFSDGVVPVTTLNVGDVVKKAEIEVEAAFNDPAAVAALGTLIPTSDNDLTEVNTYRNSESNEVTVGGALDLTVTPGTSTMGSGFALVEIARAGP